jgi:hypothetical protein
MSGGVKEQVDGECECVMMQDHIDPHLQSVFCAMCIVNS